MEKKPWMKDAVVGAPGAKSPPDKAAASVTAAATPAARGPAFHASRHGASSSQRLCAEPCTVEDIGRQIGFVPPGMHISGVGVERERPLHPHLLQSFHGATVVVMLAIVRAGSVEARRFFLAPHLLEERGERCDISVGYLWREVRRSKKLVSYFEPNNMEATVACASSAWTGLVSQAFFVHDDLPPGRSKVPWIPERSAR